MDEGIKTTETMLRAAIEIRLFALKMTIKALALLIKHLEYLKAHNLKPAWKNMIDKTQIKGVQGIAKDIMDGKRNVEQMIKAEQRKLDEFTLDKKYELEQYQIKIDKAQRAYDIEKDKKGASPQKLAKLLLEVNEVRDNKMEFEYKINKECMKKSQEIENYKSQFKSLDYDLKICNAKLNALYSDKNIATGRLNNEFQELLDRSSDYNIDSYKIPDEIKDSELYKVCNDTIKFSMDKDLSNIDDKYFEEINKNIDSINNAYENEINTQELLNKENKEDIDNRLNTDDNKNEKTYDRVENVFSKEPEMLKKYKELENDMSFQFANILKDKETAINR